MSVSTTSQHDTDPMLAQCWSAVAGAGQHLFNHGQSIVLCYVARDYNARAVDTRYTDPVPSQCCTTVPGAGQHPVNTEQYILRRSHECSSRNDNLEPMLAYCWPTGRNIGTTPIQYCITIDAHPHGGSYAGKWCTWLQRAQNQRHWIQRLG